MLLEIKQIIFICKRILFKPFFWFGVSLSAMVYIIVGKHFETSNSIQVINNSRIQNKIEDGNKCDPYIKNFKIPYVTIDNQVYPKIIPLYNNPKLNYSCLNTYKSSKIILFWNTWYGDPIFNYGIGYKKTFENNKCPVSNCELTNDRSRLKESSLIVFHMFDHIDSFPSYRTAYQKWIFYMYESPALTFDARWKPNFTNYDNLFNLSATYRLDSNFTSFYYLDFVWSKNESFDENKDFSINRTHFAAAVISNCYSKSGRYNYITELQKLISVTVFGKCGEPCPALFDNGKEGDCKEIIYTKYKFYFAFENALCKDYVTEKFFEILHHEIIPVVYGYGSYSTYIPKSAYINVLDFSTPKGLAEYLLYLDKNKTAFNSYFKWKKNIKFVENGPRLGQICELCIRLNLDIHEGIKNHVIKDMTKFWGSDNDCKIIYS